MVRKTIHVEESAEHFFCLFLLSSRHFDRELRIVVFLDPCYLEAGLCISIGCGIFCQYESVHNNTTHTNDLLQLRTHGEVNMIT